MFYQRPKKENESFKATESAEVDASALVLHQAISDSTLAKRLRDALQDAASRDARAMEALRVAVCEFTIALRDEGTTPERVLVTLKNVISQKTLPQFPSHRSDRNGTWLRESVSTWCIQSYFDQSTPCT